MTLHSFPYPTSPTDFFEEAEFKLPGAAGEGSITLTRDGARGEGAIMLSRVKNQMGDSKDGESVQIGSVKVTIKKR